MPIEALAVFAALGSAAAHLAFKKAMGTGTPRGLLAARWTTGALTMTVAVLVTAGSWGAFHPSWALLMLVLGAVIGPVVGWLLYLRALPHLDVSVAQPIFASSVVWTMLLAVTLLGERVNAFTILGAALILLGIQLLQGAGASSQRTAQPAPVAGASSTAAAAGAGTLVAAVAPPRRSRLARWLNPSGTAHSGSTTGARLSGLSRWLNPMVVPALGSAVCLGVASFCFKLGLGELTPIETNWVRTTVPALVLLGLVGQSAVVRQPGSAGGPLLTRRGLLLAMAASLANDLLGWTARLFALQHGPLVVVEPLASTAPLFVALLGTWLLGERLGRRGWLGVAATLLGGVLLGGLGR